MSLFDKLKLEELNKVFADLSFNKHQTNRNEVAHFCEHDGIFIRFTQARTAWHALAPCALKPWWLSLKTKRKNVKNNLMQENLTQQPENKITKINAAENAPVLEEPDNA